MLSPRLRKIMRDLWLNLSRTLLVILAISIGIFGFGFVLDAYSLLTQEIDANIAATNPESATLWMDKVDVGVVNIAHNFPGIADAEATRSPIRGRVQVGPDEWAVIQLLVVDDFNNLRINKFFLESESRLPDDGQILIERESLPVLKASSGNTIVVKTLDGAPREMAITGTVWDPLKEPAWVNNISYGYITPKTLEWLGGPALPSKGLRIVVSENTLDRSGVCDAAKRLSDALKRDGYDVKRVEVPIPGKFVQSDRISSFLFLLEAFGLLSLILSGFMSATLISALLSQQIRQIGVMKAVGARTHQVMGIYFGTVLCLSLLALIIAIPLSASAGRAFTIPVMEGLNFNFSNGAIPPWAFIVQVALGILIPLLTAAFPIYRGSRITVREAINDYGISLENFGTGRIDNLWGRIGGLPRPLVLSLKNAFRRRGRMILSLVMLAAGVASFIAAISSAASWYRTIDNSFINIKYDIDIRLAQPYSSEAIEKSISAISGVTGVETWGYAMSASFPKYSDGTYGGPFAVMAPPENSTLITPSTIEGRWLKPGDTNAVVIDTDFVEKAEKQGTPVHVGDELTINLNGQDTTWKVVGIIDKIGVQSAAYANYNHFAEITKSTGLSTVARVAVDGHDKTLQKTVSQALEWKLAEDGFRVFIVQGLTITRQIMVNHVILILVLLMFMSILVTAVGILGLASAMSINVMERTREIGIMRSIGATTRSIIRTVIVEGIVVGLLSWILGTIISIPLTYYIAGNAGKFIFPRVMEIVIPVWVPFLWLAIIIVVTAAASFYPAWRAARLTVSEALAYE